MSRINQIRQGDVLLQRVDEPAESTRLESQGLRVPGERTGHAHVLPAEVHQVPPHLAFRLDDGRRVDHFLRLTEEAPIRHLKPDGTRADHDPIPVPPGWWVPITQREWTSALPTPRARFD